MGKDLRGLDIGGHDDDSGLAALDDLGNLVGAFLQFSGVADDLGDAVGFVENFLGGLKFDVNCHNYTSFKSREGLSSFIGSKRADPPNPL